jgi:hypothetical protein
MKAKGFLAAEDGSHAKADDAGVGDVFEVLAHVADGEAGDSAGERSSANWSSQSTLRASW